MQKTYLIIVSGQKISNRIILLYNNDPVKSQHQAMLVRLHAHNPVSSRAIVGPHPKRCKFPISGAITLTGTLQMPRLTSDLKIGWCVFVVRRHVSASPICLLMERTDSVGPEGDVKVFLPPLLFPPCFSIWVWQEDQDCCEVKQSCYI